jgi:hypothetical protein
MFIAILGFLLKKFIAYRYQLNYARLFLEESMNTNDNSGVNGTIITDLDDDEEDMFLSLPKISTPSTSSSHCFPSSSGIASLSPIYETNIDSHIISTITQACQTSFDSCSHISTTQSYHNQSCQTSFDSEISFSKSYQTDTNATQSYPTEASEISTNLELSVYNDKSQDASQTTVVLHPETTTVSQISNLSQPQASSMTSNSESVSVASEDTLDTFCSTNFVPRYNLRKNPVKKQDKNFTYY